MTRKTGTAHSTLFTLLIFFNLIDLVNPPPPPAFIQSPNELIEALADTCQLTRPRGDFSDEGAEEEGMMRLNRK